MEHLSKLKAKISDVEGVLDSFAKRKNSLKDKPFIEVLFQALRCNFKIKDLFGLI